MRIRKRFEAVYEIDDFMGMKAYRLVHGSLKVIGD